MRFKKHKITVLLLVQPSQSFDSIKSQILDSLRATGTSEINGSAVPSDPNDIKFGSLVDKEDISQGWADLTIPEPNGDGRRSKKDEKQSTSSASPLGAGLEDGAVLAMRFGDHDTEWDVVMPAYDDEIDAMQE